MPFHRGVFTADPRCREWGKKVVLGSTSLFYVWLHRLLNYKFHSTLIQLTAFWFLHRLSNHVTSSSKATLFLFYKNNFIRTTRLKFWLENNRETIDLLIENKRILRTTSGWSQISWCISFQQTTSITDHLHREFKTTSDD